MSTKISNKYAKVMQRTKSADQSQADRPTNGQNSNSINQNGITVLITDFLQDNPIKVRGVDRVQKGFGAVYFDNDGNFIGEGVVSPNSIIQQLYPEENNAVGGFFRVSGIEKYESPRKFAEANCKGLVCLQSGAKKPACRPNWNDTKEAFVYKDMVKRDYTTFTVIPMPENIKSQVFVEE